VFQAVQGFQLSLSSSLWPVGEVKVLQPHPASLGYPDRSRFCFWYGRGYFLVWVGLHFCCVHV